MSPDEFQFYVFGSLLILSVSLVGGTVLAGILGLRRIGRKRIDPHVKRERLRRTRRLAVISAVLGGLQCQLWMFLWISGWRERVPDGWPRVFVRELSDLLTFPNDELILSVLVLGLLMAWIVMALVLDQQLRMSMKDNGTAEILRHEKAIKNRKTCGG